MRRANVPTSTYSLEHMALGLHGCKGGFLSTLTPRARNGSAPGPESEKRQTPATDYIVASGTAGCQPVCVLRGGNAGSGQREQNGSNRKRLGRQRTCWPRPV